VEILSLPASDLRSIDCGCDAKNIYVATAFLRKGASSYLSYNLTACLRIWLWLPSRRKFKVLMMAKENQAIGIDFGTTNCSVAVYKEGWAEIIANEQGSDTLPAMVAFFSGQRLVGEAAKDQFTSNPQNTVFDIKRFLGRSISDNAVKIDNASWPFDVVCGENDKPIIEMEFKGMERRFATEEICAMILHKLKAIAEAHLNCKVRDTVVTVPAYFNVAQREALKEAATIAGLHVMQVMDEPTAAVVAYGLDASTYSSSVAKQLLIFDLGGHTLDISLVSVKNGVPQVQVLGGDAHLGGQDFDGSLVDYCAIEFQRKYNKISKKFREPFVSFALHVKKQKYVSLLLGRLLLELIASLKEWVLIQG
ncbi:hypothetical protein KI387_041347, partial [Taxus chinensis]